MAAGAACARPAIVANAPFTMRNARPPGSVAVASDILFAGSNGTNFTSVGRSAAFARAAAARMAASTGSWPPSELASAANASTRFSSKPGMARTAVTASSFCVSVPVLSAHSTSMVAASSTAERRVGRTPRLASARAPNAVASVKVAGSATGIAASMAVSASGTISATGNPRTEA